jgi:hypothetical protein
MTQPVNQLRPIPVKQHQLSSGRILTTVPEPEHTAPKSRVISLRDAVSLAMAVFGTAGGATCAGLLWGLPGVFLVLSLVIVAVGIVLGVTE